MIHFTKSKNLDWLPHIEDEDLSYLAHSATLSTSWHASEMSIKHTLTLIVSTDAHIYIHAETLTGSHLLYKFV